MENILLIGLLINLLAIIWQDFRQRSIHVGVLFLLTILAGIHGCFQLTWLVWLGAIAFNLAFMLVQLLGISLYYWFKENQWVWIADVYLGWGDIWFLGAAALLFSPMQWIIFYVGSLLLVLVGTLCYRTYREVENFTIPLAGGQAIVLIIILMINH